MRGYAAIVVACWGLGLSAQGFNKRYDAFGQGNAQTGWGIERTANGYVLISGSYEPDTITVDSIIGSYALIMHGINNQGEVLWQKRYRREQYAEFAGWTNCCDSVRGGGFVVGGSAQANAGGDFTRLVRFDQNGDSLWSSTFGGAGQYWVGSQVRQTADGGYLLCGYTNATGFEDGFVIRTDSAGNELWRQTYGWSGPVYIDALAAIEEAVDGELYMSGSRFTSFEENQHWVQRTGANGDLVWRMNWGSPYTEGATNLMLHSSGRPVVAGGWGTNANGYRRPYLAMLDPDDGSIIWDRTYGNAYFATLFFAAKECPNTDIIACGGSNQGSNEQGLLTRTTASGDSIWMRTYFYVDSLEDSGQGRFHDVLPTEDGGFIAAGRTYPVPAYSQDAWIVKVDSMGCIVPGCDATGVTEIVTNLKDGLNVYPNPVVQGGPVTVQVTLPEGLRKDPLQLTVVSADGRLVEQRNLTSNTAQFTLHTSGYASGLYHLHLTSGSTWLSGAKLVVE